MELYGCLENRLMENTLTVVPEVGMGATYYAYSDRHPYTIVEVSEKLVEDTILVQMNDGTKENVTRMYPSYIIVQKDEHKIISGSAFDGSAEYEYKQNTEASREKYIYHKATNSYREESQVWVEDLSITEEVARERDLWLFNGYYKPTGRTNKKEKRITPGRREYYYDPSF